MSAAACKIPINCNLLSDSRSLGDRVEVFERLVALPGFEKIPKQRRELFFERAMEIDKRASAILQEALAAYDELNLDIGNTIED